MQKTKLTFWQMWNISFGFFGVQIAYSLQNANISRIFATLGADPHDLSFFWILPPLMGLIVQPLVGKYSDRTWTRLGRRIPYLFLGSIIAILVMCTTLPYGLQLTAKGLAAACKEDPGMMNGLNVYDGKCTFAAVAEALGLEYTDPATLL